MDDEKRQSCQELIEPLLDIVNQLVTFATSPKFLSSPAKISAQGHVAQEPILQASKQVNTSSRSLLGTAKKFIINSDEGNLLQQLVEQSENVSDSLKALIAVVMRNCGASHSFVAESIVKSH